MNHQPREALNTFVEACLNLLTGDASGHAAEICLFAGCNSNCHRSTAFHTRTEKTNIGEFQRRDIVACFPRVKLFYRQ